MTGRWMLTVSEIGNGTILMQGFENRVEAEARLDYLLEVLGEGHAVRLFDRKENLLIDEVEV